MAHRQLRWLFLTRKMDKIITQDLQFWIYHDGLPLRRLHKDTEVPGDMTKSMKGMRSHQSGTAVSFQLKKQPPSNLYLKAIQIYLVFGIR